MTNFTSEMIEKAKAAKTAEELLALAKENNVEMTEEEAKAYYAQLNPASGELDDDELDNVAGGGCGDDGISGPTVYYDTFTEGMKVVAGGYACSALTNSIGCSGNMCGYIHFDSKTSWSVTCAKCGRVYNGTGNPGDRSFMDTKYASAVQLKNFG